MDEGKKNRNQHIPENPAAALCSLNSNTINKHFLGIW